MTVREDLLNGRIATVIRESINGIRWTVQEENDGVFATSDRRPDILITRPSPEPPFVIENEYNAANVEGDCRNKLGQALKPDLGGETIETVIGVHSPNSLHKAADSDIAEAMLRNGEILQYAVYTGTPENFTRFPSRGFISGNIRNLIEFAMPAAEPADIIKKAADILAEGASVAAKAIIDAAQNYSQAGVSIAETLRQPWPLGNSANPEQGKADREARLQTANMASTIIINALAYQQNLDGYNGIKGLAQVRSETAAKKLDKDAVVAEFERILSINYWPIFHVAKELLLQIPGSTANDMLEKMADTANGITAAIRHNDVAGTLFQQLIADRKTLKTYYTMPAATTLMAHLTIPENLAWGNPETLRGYTIADYACGSGGIMLALYQRARELHRLHGGNPDEHHAYMMQECLTACDIMPAAVHLTASLLSSVAPTVQYQGTRCILFPFGGRRKTDNNGVVVRDRAGNPVKETDNQGNPIVNLGSIELLDLNATRYQAVLPLAQQTTLGAQGRRQNIEVSISPLSQSVVGMNPPFTRPTKHAPRKSSESVDPKNPAFAAFGTTDAEQEAMKKLESKLAKNTISDGNAGLGTTFTAIGNNMVRRGGHIALILPATAMTGGSYSASKNQAFSWQNLRNLVYDNYTDIVVVSIAQPRKKDSAFSADSDFADCMVIARRLNEGQSPAGQAHFVNLISRPATKLEASETARAIKAAIRETVKPGTQSDIHIGNDIIGFVRLETIRRNHRWTAIRIANGSLVDRLHKLQQGILRLPQSSIDFPIPVTQVGNLGQVGPLSRDISERGPFIRVEKYSSDNEYPMLWNHYPVKKADQVGKDPQKTMLTRPDSHGRVRDGQDKEAALLWQNATYLHINEDFQFNGNSTAAAYTPQKALGGRMWPTLQMASPEQEKALCVWLNSTLGLATYWIQSDRGQDGRGAISVTAIPGLVALDVKKLNREQLQAAVRIFDDLKEKRMLPGNEAWRDPVRKELDERLFVEVLGLTAAEVAQLDILRRQWCKEPTVTATKKTGPVD